MNMFNLDVTQRCLIAECWCPVEDLDEIQRALMKGTVSVTMHSTWWCVDDNILVGEVWFYSSFHPE